MLAEKDTIVGEEKGRNGLAGRSGAGRWTPGSPRGMDNVWAARPFAGLNGPHPAGTDIWIDGEEGRGRGGDGRRTNQVEVWKVHHEAASGPNMAGNEAS